MDTVEVPDTVEDTELNLVLAAYTEEAPGTAETVYWSSDGISVAAVDPVHLQTGQTAQPMSCHCSDLFLAVCSVSLKFSVAIYLDSLLYCTELL